MSSPYAGLRIVDLCGGLEVPLGVIPVAIANVLAGERDPLLHDLLG